MGYYTKNIMFSLGSNLNVPTFDADAQAFLTATSITDALISSAINTLVLGLKSGNLWGRMKGLYPLVGGTVDKNKYNLKDPKDADSSFRLSFINSPTHSSNGIAFNGTSQYAVTHIVPSSHLEQNSASIGLYLRSDFNRQAGSGVEVSLLLYPKWTDGSALAWINTGTNVGKSRTTSKGFVAGSRVNSTQQIICAEGGYETANFNSTGRSNFKIPFMARENSANSFDRFDNRGLSFAFVGLGFSGSELLLIETIVNDFQTKLGRNV